MLYYHTAYGLNLVSTLDIPELVSTEETGSLIQPDIEIMEGEIEINFDGPITSGPFFQASKTDCLLTTPEGSRYWLHQGQKIIISRNSSSSDEIVRYFLIYGALPILLIQRGIFLLHGSAVSNGQRALVFLGASRSGKSTLAAGFWQRGWRLISDELIVCAVDSAQRVCVQPGIPQILLWRDAFEQLNLAGSLGKPTRVMNQFTLSAGKQFEDKLVPIQSIFILECILKGVSQVEAHGRIKFSHFLQNIYLPCIPRPQATNVIQSKIPMLLTASTPLETIFWSLHQVSANDLLLKILERSE